MQRSMSGAALLVLLSVLSGVAAAQTDPAPPPSVQAPAAQPNPEVAAPAQADAGLTASAQTAVPARPSRYSADQLYNAANSYARAGKPGLAVLNYERAALLAPGDSDINANLQSVQAAAHVGAQPRGRIAQLVQTVDPVVAAWLGMIGIVLAGVSLLMRKWTVRHRGLRATGLVVGVALISLTVTSAALQWPQLHQAVVLVNQAAARVSPVPMGDTLFTLPEAETVTIAAEHEDYLLIRTRDRRSGWVARADVGLVRPPGKGRWL